MSDGFEDRTNTDLSSDYGFVGQDGDERAPGNGWEFEPTRRQLRRRVTWHGRLRLAYQRLTGSFNRR